MSKAVLSFLLCGIGLPSSLAMAAPADTTNYLNWPEKTLHSKAEHYGVPPSPYGEVGNFYKKQLNWSGKASSQTPQVLASVTSLPPEAVRSRPERYVPEPVQPYVYRAMPQVSSRVPQPAPMASLTNAPALPAPQPRVTPEMLRDATQPVKRPVVKPLPKPVTMAPIPDPEPKIAVAPPKPASVVAAKSQPTPQPTPPVTATASINAKTYDSGYQLPTTSKYYRGATTTATTDNTFVPGETITDPATQSPRFYSLHRAYGLTPDAIPVTPEEAGNNLPVAQTAPENQPSKPK